MSPLLPCPGCARHVRALEPICPFCSERLPASVRGPVPRWPLARLGRAATFAFGVATASTVTLSGCGDDSGPADAGSADAAGGDAGPAPLDAGPAPEDGGGPVDAGTDAGNAVPPYGTPPEDAGTPEGDAGGPVDAGTDAGGPAPPYGAPPDDGGTPAPLYGAPPPME